MNSLRETGFQNYEQRKVFLSTKWTWIRAIAKAISGAFPQAKALLPFSKFLCICDYLGVTTKEFFGTDTQKPQLVYKLAVLAKNMITGDLAARITMAEHLSDE